MKRTEHESRASLRLRWAELVFGLIALVCLLLFAVRYGGWNGTLDRALFWVKAALAAWCGFTVCAVARFVLLLRQRKR